MCGICGIAYYTDGRQVEPSILLVMRDALRHRGPDDAGLLIDGRVGLANRRLSIIDLETGNQPIHNEDSTLWIIFNGEIYNYQALREDLLQRGHVFYTRGDTETLLHLYEEVGVEMFSRLNGMFALCIWDIRQHTLLLARDRLGQKPLYYTLTHEAFLFASELKALLHHPSVGREIDELSLSKYLTYEYVPTPHSMLKGIKRLPPGTFLRYHVQTREVAIKTYWDIPVVEAAIAERSEEEYAEQLLHVLRESVQLRLMSDVPVGIFLSGGIDSSLITALAAQGSGEVKTFTIGFEEASFDESHYANQIARLFGTDHHTDILDIRTAHTLLPEIIAYLDEPLADKSIIPTFLLSKFTSQHVKVALGGDGSDELFAGYPTFQAFRLSRYYTALPRPIRSTIQHLAAKLPVSHQNMSLDFKIKQALRGMDAPHEMMFFLWMGAFNEHEKHALLTPLIRQAIKNNNPFEDLLAHLDTSNVRQPFERILYLLAKLYLQDDILVKVDRASMANSLEVRAPFLDYRLVEFAAKLPKRYKLHRLTTKYLLKKAALNILPRHLVKRQKKGFGIPVSQWICGAMQPVFEQYLHKERIVKDGIFKYAMIERLLDEHIQMKMDHRKLLWTLLIFQMWKEYWVDSRS